MKKSPKKKDNANQLDLAKYFGLAFQMIGIILIGALTGRWLDGYFATEKAYFAASFSLIAVFFSLWYVFKDLVSLKK